jgi:cation diffusion facilitator CzcD-associated flavoprotein CzcO
VRGLTVFQRTAQWVLPMPNRRYSRLIRSILERFPRLNVVYYRLWQTFFERMFGRAVVEPGWRRPVVDAWCRWNLSRVRNPELRRRLTPDYRPMCKRLVMSAGYYRAMQKPGVHLVTEPIDHVEPTGVVTADGRRHELDMIVLATGFEFHAYVRPLELRGENGLALDEAWANGPRAYRTVAMPGFPNLFMLMGPHSPVGNQSLVLVAESQADYALWWIDRLRRSRIASAAPTVEATAKFNADMKAAMPQTIWVTGCRSWYLGRDGLPELFPWRPERHRELLAEPVLADFDVST